MMSTDGRLVLIARSEAEGPVGEEREDLERGGARGGRLLRALARFRLTPRQFQVLELLVGGASNKEIASVLGTSDKTVEAHVTQLLRKAGVGSRAALISRVLS